MDPIKASQAAAGAPSGGAVIQTGAAHRAVSTPHTTAIATDNFHGSHDLAAQVGSSANAAMKSVDDHLGPYGFGVADPLVRPMLKVYAAIAGGIYGVGKFLAGK